MSWKKKFGMGAVSAALGLSLVGGGTYAYFSDTEVSKNNFTAGTLDLSLNPETIVNIENLKPGDKVKKTFDIKNDGSLPIDKVLLGSSYEVMDAKGDNAKADFGEHIRVNFLKNVDGKVTIIKSKTLKELNNISEDLLKEKGWFLVYDTNLKVGAKDKIEVEFEFVDNKKNQNVFQGDSVELKWTFKATQTDGESR
ncbi:TasA family protein [Priestia taiwanensis]|uniref:Cell division protein FtsN n=1 Tax=Priestia taiwanensis TaxID=1347902 RepID=A0A917AXA7_9BACI|nr:TasA family protein [Priestia taiwanensis]MBM7363396.1 spore coat-associated protein N [Priestia taiwanensis]GGE77488.1 cell division protein FtsN [Priestia taiwanensis]